MKLLNYPLVISVLLLAAAAYGADHDLSRVAKPVPAENHTVYESVIMPWLNDEFLSTTFVSSDGAYIQRALVNSYLLKYEKLGGQSRYSVHIEYRVSVKENGRVVLNGLKGQEIIFFIEDGQVKDYFPFDEYWIKGDIQDQTVASNRM